MCADACGAPALAVSPHPASKLDSLLFISLDCMNVKLASRFPIAVPSSARTKN